MSRLTEGRSRQREQTDRGKVQETGANFLRGGSGDGSKLPEGRFRQREQTDRGKDKAKGAD